MKGYLELYGFAGQLHMFIVRFHVNAPYALTYLNNGYFAWKINLLRSCISALEPRYKVGIRYHLKA